MLKIGDPAPDFCLRGDQGQICLNDLKGKWVALYFYPKDNTSGCTMEALEFTALNQEFESEGAKILGVSADSVESHAKFRERKNLTHALLSDEEKKTLEAYGVWQTKKMYGKEFKGVIRSTYLIGPKGVIAYIWPKVKPEGHADEVLEKIKELK
ncbi:peroxiredoxin [Candidatus Bathyarchaeota archaeon RBG_13_52_12]|nr:MAG: peroxiredoxin [Candidatus Bathyarchaeota archaeon RBG_13_52_12]